MLLRTTTIGLTFAVLSLFSPLRSAQAFTFTFAGESNGVDVVTHSSGYSGAGGTLGISVGIDPTSANKNAMMISVANVVHTWNNLVPTTGNLSVANVPFAEFDFESVLLHEMGHSLGLGHPNLGFIPDPNPMNPPLVIGLDTNYTSTTNGANNVFDLDAGVDNIIGSADDMRGDDVNLNYFRVSNNNPFTIDATVDQTTYSRNLTALPAGDSFSTNADRTVASSVFSLANTEAVLQQGTPNGEAQRTLGHDDVAGLRYAMSGVDEMQGTSDDYTVLLSFVGESAAADIVIDFDNSKTGFAVAQLSSTSIATDHRSITNADIFFNDGTQMGNEFTWFFNDVSSVPEPSTIVLSLLGVAFFALYAGFHRRQRTTTAFAA